VEVSENKLKGAGKRKRITVSENKKNKKTNRYRSKNKFKGARLKKATP